MVTVDCHHRPWLAPRYKTSAKESFPVSDLRNLAAGSIFKTRHLCFARTRVLFRAVNERRLSFLYTFVFAVEQTLVSGSKSERYKQVTKIQTATWTSWNSETLSLEKLRKTRVVYSTRRRRFIWNVCLSLPPPRFPLTCPRICSIDDRVNYRRD